MLESKHFWLFNYLVVLFHITVCAAVLSETKSSDLPDVPSLKKKLKATVTVCHLLSVLLNLWGKKLSALLHIHVAQKGLFFFPYIVHIFCILELAKVIRLITMNPFGRRKLMTI